MYQKLKNLDRNVRSVQVCNKNVFDFAPNAVVETLRVLINAIPFIFFEADVRSFEFKITA